MFRFSTTRLLVATALLSCMPAFGQNAAGSISGTVTDATGAVVPNAKVELIDEATNTHRDSVANGSGLFTFAAVQPATYDVLVSAPGFTSWERKGIVLNQGGSLNVPGISLQVGSSTQQVEVVSSAEVVVPQDTGQTSQTLNEHMITELAIQGRDAAELIKIMPGMGNNNGLSNSMWNSLTTASNSGPIGAFSASGTQPNGGMTMTLDGANLLDPGNQGTQTANVNQNQTAEVTILTSAYDASFAKGPVTFQAIGKSGTAHFHGDVYFYARNGIFSSEDSYLKNQGEKKPEDSYYYPGGDIGGPVIIPGLRYNKNHDKLFFYGAYEYMNQNPEGSLLSRFIPTADMMGQNPSKPYADFTPSYLASLGSQWNSNFATGGATPITSQGCGGTGTGCIPMQYAAPYVNNGTYSFSGAGAPNNPTYGQIPLSQIDSNSLALWKLMPTPNVDPASHGGYNYQTLISQPVDRWELRLRGDWNISDKHHAFFSWDRQDEQDQNPISVWWYMGNALPYPSAMPANQKSQVYSTNLTSMLTPTLTNEVVFSSASFLNPIALANPNAVNPSKVGFNMSNTFFSTPYPQLPNTISWNNGVPGYSAPAFGSTFQGGDFGKLSQAPSIQDNLTKVLGTNTLKAGFYWDSDRNQQTSGGWSGGPMGVLDFENYGSNSTNNEFANFATGRVTSFEQQSAAPIDDFRYHQYSFYVNDQWKANRRLTVNGGLRFDHIGAWYPEGPSGSAGLAVFDPATYNNTCTTCAWTGAEWHAIDSKIPISGFPSKPFFVEPRVGFAYDIFGNGKTVLRGGFGEYRYQLAYNSVAGSLNPGLNVQNYTSTWNCCIGYNSFNSYTPSLGAAGLGGSAAGLLTMGDNKTPYTDSYNFTVSQQGPWKSVMEFSYVGNRSRDLLENSGLSNLDNVPVGAYFGTDPLTGSVISPYTPTCASPAVQPCQTGTFNANDYLPYHQYTSLQLIGHGSYQNYNSLQVTWQKQTGRYTFTTNYTFGKVLGIRDGESDNGGGNGSLLDPFNIKDNYGVLAYDHTHIFNAAYVVNIPSLAKNKFVGGFVNGWELSGITQLQSGAPIQPNTGGTMNVVWPSSYTYANGVKAGIDNSNWIGTGSETLVPALTCNPASNLKSGQYFNPSCFTIPAYGSNGTVVWPYIHGPAFFNSDLSLYKNFAIKESQKIQLRLEAFNFLNHPLEQFNASGNSSDIKLSFNPSAGYSTTNTNALTNGYPLNTVGRRVVEMAIKYEF